ncbi:hypothetical protein TNCV_946731 [Trichonephila clavipes]|nr:hypothetical protein TNCV_946731 [Trichonephila clavipes]
MEDTTESNTNQPVLPLPIHYQPKSVNVPIWKRLRLPNRLRNCRIKTRSRLIQSPNLLSAGLRRILEIKVINSFPPKIIWRYGIYPKLFDKMSDIEFHEGMPFDVEDITNAFVIIDDLMNEVGDDKRTFKLVHERKPS